MKAIGKIYTDMPEKFGVPRQSGLVKELVGKIILDPPYNVSEAFDGIEDFSHLWILWQFSENEYKKFSPTVRPPRLGGEKRKGVFASRSPFRPNSIGMSCVKLESVEHTKENGVVLIVSGVDMVNETPILDIKPYITYTDCIPTAKQGFAEEYKDYSLNVNFDDKLLEKIPVDKQSALLGILSQDPRPAYQNDPNREYGLSFMNFNIKFRVADNMLTVFEVTRNE